MIKALNTIINSPTIYIYKIYYHDYFDPIKMADKNARQK